MADQDMELDEDFENQTEDETEKESDDDTGNQMQDLPELETPVPPNMPMTPADIEINHLQRRQAHCRTQILFLQPHLTTAYKQRTRLTKSLKRRLRQEQTNRVPLHEGSDEEETSGVLEWMLRNTEERIAKWEGEIAEWQGEIERCEGEVGRVRWAVAEEGMGRMRIVP